MKVITSFVNPPIPTRKFDWEAHIQGEEDGFSGVGETEVDALRDLCEQLALQFYERGPA